MNIFTEIEGEPLLVHVFSSLEEDGNEVTHTLVNYYSPERSKAFIASKTTGKDAIVVHKMSTDLKSLVENFRVPEIENIKEFINNVHLISDRFVTDRKDRIALKRIIKKYM